MGLFSLFQRLLRKSVTLPGRVAIQFFGLGNKGEAYAFTRHNIGFRVAEALAERLKNQKSGYFGEADFTFGTLFSTIDVLVVRPRTFMNRSGSAVAKYLSQWRVPESNALMIVDDYYLPIGKLRIRRSGSDGGHNGLKSIIEQIGENFPRLRVGIGPIRENLSSVDFVLSSFTPTEEGRLKEVIPRAVEACMLFAKEGIEAVMNSYNG